MILDSFQEIDLIENADLPGGGLPVYIVADNKPRKAKIKFFRECSTAHNTRAEREFPHYPRRVLKLPALTVLY